jgi:hypothetical protein
MNKCLKELEGNANKKLNEIQMTMQDMKEKFNKHRN